MIPDISFIYDMIAIITTVIFIFTIVGALFSYIVTGFGLYYVLKTQGHEKPINAFVPFIRDYLEGDVTGQILGAKGKKNIMIKSCFVIGCILSLISSVAFKCISSKIDENIFDAISDNAMLIPLLVGLLIFSIMSVAVALSMFVLRFMVLYKVGYHVAIAILITWFLPTFWLFFVYRKMRKSNTPEVIVEL